MKRYIYSSSNNKKYQCYYYKTVFIETPDGRSRGHQGKKVITETFDNEADAETYCRTHVGSQKVGDEWIDNEMNYDEIDASTEVSASSDSNSIKWQLIKMYKDNPELILTYEKNSKYTDGGYIKEVYAIGPGDSGEVDMDRQNYYINVDYIGRETVASGYAQVADAVAKLQPDLSKWQVVDESIDSSTEVAASERFDGSWDKRYDSLGDYTYYVMSSPKGSARVNCLPDKYIAVVKIRETGKTYSYTIARSELTKSEFDAMDWAQDILWNRANVDASTNVTADDTVRGHFDVDGVKSFLKEKLAGKIDSIITFTDGGFYDLEKQGISGIGIYVGYQHKGSASSKARERVLRNSMYDVENAFAEYCEYEGIDPDSMKVNDYVSSMDMFRIWAPADPEQIDASTNIEASNDIILPFKEIQKGMCWHRDYHDFTVTAIAPNGKTCTIVEEWIAEDSGRECTNTEEYMIKDDDNGDGEYVTLPGYEDHWRLYAVGADNFPLEEMMKQAENDDAELYGKNPYSDEDPYDDDYRSSTAGDYGPSNPWDAPGMRVSDFI